jgi:hypothetical protein
MRQKDPGLVETMEKIEEKNKMRIKPHTSAISSQYHR